MREPKKGEIVRLKSDGKEYKVLDYCLGLISLRENAKGSRNKKEVSLSEIEYTEPERVCLTMQEKKAILRRLVEEKTLKESFQREIILLCKLWKKFPHKQFWLEGFCPALKADSLTYWYNRAEVETLYKNWAINLESKQEEIVLEKEKIGEDIVIPKRKARNILELLT